MLHGTRAAMRQYGMDDTARLLIHDARFLLARVWAGRRLWWLGTGSSVDALHDASLALARAADQPGAAADRLEPLLAELDPVTSAALARRATQGTDGGRAEGVVGI